MKKYRIAHKNNMLIAVDVSDKDGGGNVQILEESGFIIENSLIEADSTNEAIEQFINLQMESLTKAQELQSSESFKDSKWWDIFSILFVIAMIIVSEL